MKINFFNLEDGEELACLELSRAPMVNDFTMIDGKIHRVKAVEWTIKKNVLEAVQVYVRDVRQTDAWRR